MPTGGDPDSGGGPAGGPAGTGGAPPDGPDRRRGFPEGGGTTGEGLSEGGDAPVDRAPADGAEGGEMHLASARTLAASPMAATRSEAPGASSAAAAEHCERASAPHGPHGTPKHNPTRNMID
eukprot:2220592-Alexandrium_andersonii.AAC.1